VQILQENKEKKDAEFNERFKHSMYCQDNALIPYYAVFVHCAQSFHHSDLGVVFCASTHKDAIMMNLDKFSNLLKNCDFVTLTASSSCSMICTC